MRKAKGIAGSAGVALKSGTKTAARTTGPKKAQPLAAAKRKAVSSPPEAVEDSAITEAQSKVVASKFVTSDTTNKRPVTRPTLPVSYGESHILLLVRDPQTLFAAWDMAPAAVQTVRSQIGARAFAVSTLTLRLTEAGGRTNVFHVGKKVRSRYLKIGGSPSFMAEIGFTTPAGRFELIASSAPCFVPLGPSGRQETLAPKRRSVLGYREAQILARRGVVPVSSTGAKPRGRSTQAAPGAPFSVGPSARRALGGASDLYRR